MKITELYEIFLQYAKLTKSKKFTVLDIEISEFLYYNGNAYAYTFKYNNIQYNIISTYNSNEVNDEILIQLFKHTKKLIRKEKINQILLQDFNI